MNDRDKRKAVHNYQFSVYTPQDRTVVHTDPLVWEIAGCSFPYRKEEFDIRCLGAFLTRDDQKWYWHPKVTYEMCHPNE
jgi:hypothetical protein